MLVAFISKVMGTFRAAHLLIGEKKMSLSNQILIR